jgi:starvation-inducible DNA-binding protein
MKTKETINLLNTLLSNYQQFYMNLRGFHWNIKGKKFFELHLKFEELYNNIQLKIDELAERILTLDGTPVHDFKTFIEKSSIQACVNVSDGDTAIQHIIDNFKTIVALEYEILKTSDELNDEGTNALMSDYIREQEKIIWMFKAYMS